MDYYQQDFMVKLGETAAGDIIEVPDILIYGLAFGFVFTLFLIAVQRDKK
tara:strand:- start:1108 stop:1257 length:150 start_codon:yes stop_codon:yes gene_type:complete